MTAKNEFHGEAAGVVQIGTAGDVVINQARRPSRWYAAGYAATALAVFAGGGLYWANLPAKLEAVADYHREVELPRVVHPRVIGQTEFPSDQMCHAVVDWAVAQGASYASEVPVRLYLRGRSVDINRIRVVVTERLDAPTGTSFKCMPAGGSETVKLTVNLDEERSFVREEKTGRLYGEDKAITLQDEAMFFDITPTTTKCLCRWHIEIEHYEGGELVTMPVKAPDGKEFETAAVAAVQRDYWALGQRWVTMR